MIAVEIIAVLIAIPLLAAAFMSNRYSILAAITIYKQRQQVFDFLKMLKHADQYNKWIMMDPAMEKKFSGTDGTIGFVYSWNSRNKNAGQGEQEIVDMKEGEYISYEIRFIKPFQGVSNAALQMRNAGHNETTVEWTFSGDRNYPMRIFHFLFNLKKVLQKDLQTSLTNLKNVLEKS